MITEAHFSAFDSHLSADVVAVEIDGALRESEHGGNLLRALALADVVGNLYFRRGQPDRLACKLAGER